MEYIYKRQHIRKLNTFTRNTGGCWVPGGEFDEETGPQGTQACERTGIGQDPGQYPEKNNWNHLFQGKR